MKRYDSDDELERALFALPLEEPPADLRASILTRTIYRSPAPFKLWEGWAIGAVIGIIIWISALIVGGGAALAMQTLGTIGGALVAFFSQPVDLLWTAVGAASAFWMSQINLTPLSLSRRPKLR